MQPQQPPRAGLEPRVELDNEVVDRARVDRAAERVHLPIPDALLRTVHVLRLLRVRLQDEVLRWMRLLS